MRLTVTIQREDAKFNIAKAEIDQEEAESLYGIWSSSHPLHAHTSIYGCSDATECPVCCVLRRH